MFEKEAEESFMCKKVLYKWETDKRSYIDGFKDGYNKAKEEVEEKYKETICNLEMNLNSVTEQLEELEKANEWHYVKDGINPTHSYRVLVFTDEGVGFGIYGLDDKKWHTYDTGFEVIAWKEIVLPELKESE